MAIHDIRYHSFILPRKERGEEEKKLKMFDLLVVCQSYLSSFINSSRSISKANIFYYFYDLDEYAVGNRLAGLV